MNCLHSVFVVFLVSAVSEAAPQRQFQAAVAAPPQRQFQAAVAPGFHGDASLAKIVEEQRFSVGQGNERKFGHAAQQEDGVIIMEESSGGNNRIGQYSYIGDDGKTYTVKYEAGVNGFRILDGAHIPSGGQHAADNIVDENEEPYEYDYEYYEDVPTDVKSPFVNPHDPTHQQPELLAGNLAGHLAGIYQTSQRLEESRRPKDPISGLLLTTTPAPLRIFPAGKIAFDRFEDGFNFKFRSNK